MKGKNLVFGGKCTESLAYWNQESLCWRMSQQSLLLVEPMSLEALPKSGMTANGRLYQLHNVEHPTSEKGGFVLPTPTASDPDKHGTGGLHRRLVRGQTYSSGDHRMKNLPTPTAHMFKEGGYPAEHKRDSPTIHVVVGAHHSGENPKYLNPQFVEWMMGFPQDWTELPEETTDTD